MPEQLDLIPITTRAEAATDGPWEVCIFAPSYRSGDSEEYGVHCPQAAESYLKPDDTWHTLHICRGMTGPNRVANAVFIAAARQDVLTLVAEVTRLYAAPAPSASTQVSLFEVGALLQRGLWVSELLAAHLYGVPDGVGVWQTEARAWLQAHGVRVLEL